jgi:hypothetical protein
MSAEQQKYFHSLLVGLGNAVTRFLLVVSPFSLSNSVRITKKLLFFGEVSQWDKTSCLIALAKSFATSGVMTAVVIDGPDSTI